MGRALSRIRRLLRARVEIVTLCGGSHATPMYTNACNQGGTRLEGPASIVKKQASWEPACPKCRSHETRQTYSSVAVEVGMRPSQGE